MGTEEDSVELSKEEKAFISEMAALNLKGVVIRKGVVSVRMFSLGGGKTVVAYLLQETDDGFIVALPVCLNSNPQTNEVTAEFISPTTMLKLFKTGSYLLALPTPTIFYHYLNLTKDRFGSLPGFFNEERKAQVDTVLSQLKITYDIKGSSIPSGFKHASKPNPVTSTPVQEDRYELESFVVDSRTSKYRH
jgi:hypothetical protein